MSTNRLQSSVQGQAFKLVLMQLLCVCAIAVVGLFMSGLVTASSILAGGLAYVLPSLVFVWRVFRYVGAQQMTKFVSAFFIGEMLKLFLSAIFFVLIIKYLPVHMVPVMIGFVTAIMSFWFACMWMFSKSATVKQSRD